MASEHPARRARQSNIFSDWSFDIGKLFGIRIRVHPTFLILLAWVALAHFLEGHSFLAALGGAIFLILIFAVVVMHELAHALTARRFGIETRDITLLPIGGVSSLERIPEKPSQELAVALAGPAFNIAFAIALFAFGYLVYGQVPWPIDVDLVGGSLVNRLAWVNVTLGVFNLIPAFPMDGGRVLRAALALKLPRGRATDIAAAVGHALAIVLGLVGLLMNPLLLFIAWFVWVGASHEAQMERAKSLLHGLTAQSAMVTSVQTLTPDEPLDHAVAVARDSFQSDYPVVVGDRAVGILSRQRIYEIASKPHAGHLVADFMEAPLTSAPSEPLDDLLLRFGETSSRAAVVVDHDHFAGLITQEKLADLMLAQSTLKRAA